jgi:hypothetical protein
MEMIDVLTRLRDIAESRPELVKDAVDNVTRTNPKVDESGMKRAMEDDAESMSKDEFVEKYGSAMAGFWEAYNGAEESTTNESPYTTDKEGAGYIMANKDKIITQLYAGGIQSVLDPKDAVKAISDLIPDVTEKEIVDIIKKDNAFAGETDVEEAGGGINDMEMNLKMAFASQNKYKNINDFENSAEWNQISQKLAREGKEMKKETVKESIQISADTPQEASMMMQLLKLAGVQPVDQDMISQGEPEAEPEANHDDEMGSQEMGRMRDMMTAPAEEKAEETFDNEPEEKVSDIDTLVNVHSGGLNRKKQAFAKAQDGDNAMAVEDTITAEDLTNSLRAQYESFKEAYQKEAKIAEAKPDFLDMDKDGDKKEPMKKAIKDKEAKTEAKDEKCEKCGKMHLTASSCGGSH